MYTVEQNNLNLIANQEQSSIIKALELGNIVYFPHYYFKIHDNESYLFSEEILAPRKKNISYNILTTKLGGTNKQNNMTVKLFMHRYATFAQELIHNTLPQYKDALIWGRTSYRPAEIKGRITSKRKDDTRLHVDAFAATPVNGLRILRVFCNVNPFGVPRVWNTGEDLPTVINKFAHTIPPYNSFKAYLYKTLKITKTLRSSYDHHMLHLHDNMKLDDEYQKNVEKNCFHFPANSTWIVFTDQTSHAALSGQFLLEQTFYLPVEAMAKPEHSPLRQWENIIKNCCLCEHIA